MDSTITIRKGLNLRLPGAPEQSIETTADVQHIALCGLDYPGLKPKLLVREGDSVGLGQPIWVDKRDPEVNYVAPGQGTVIAVNRGLRRILQTLVIRLEDNDIDDRAFEPLTSNEMAGQSRDQIVRRLQESGCWTAFKTRPYSQVPASGLQPRSIFVTAIDTDPFAADPEPVIEREKEAFSDGLAIISRLTDGAVHLCTPSDWKLSLPTNPKVKHTGFAGPHPAGLPGTHIHFLDPVGAERTVWQIGYQDVIAIGKLFRDGRLSMSRVIALAGSQVLNPCLIETRLGASTDELTRGQIRDPDDCRVIAGSLLSGRTATGPTAFLGRYHRQINVISEGGEKKFMGWMFRNRGAVPTTSQNGRFSGMLPMTRFDRIMPLDILPSPLLRALSVRDTDQAQALGCLELDEEDLALCSYLCPAKTDYGALLRLNLQQIQKEG